MAMFLAFWRRRRQGRHSRLPLGRRQVLISFKGWPRRQWVCRAARADGPSPRNMFSRGVTGSMWAGKMQGRFRQRWSDSSPSGIGPTSVSYAKRCACRNLAVRSRRLPTLNRPYPVRRVAVHSQHPFSRACTKRQKRTSGEIGVRPVSPRRGGAGAVYFKSIGRPILSVSCSRWSSATRLLSIVAQDRRRTWLNCISSQTARPRRQPRWCP